jgi:hypothetical protein
MVRDKVWRSVLGLVVLGLASCFQKPSDQNQNSTEKTVTKGTGQDGGNKPETPQATEPSLKDLIDASFSEKDRARLSGKSIRVAGYYQPENAKSASISINIMHCCAADIIAVKIKLDSDGKAFEKHIKPAWVEILGHASFVERGDTDKWFDPILHVPSADCIVSAPQSDGHLINVIGKVPDPDRYSKWATKLLRPQG